MAVLRCWPMFIMLCVALLVACTGVTVSPCGSDQTAEVIQNKINNTYTCSGVPADQQVLWRLLYQTNGFSAGSCPGNEGACTGGDLGGAFNTIRVNSTAIRLIVDATQLTNDVIVRSGTLRCAASNSNDNCQTDYIVPAQGTCSTQTGTGSERFTRTGSCSLQAGAMTSRGRYRCEWYQRHQTSLKSLISNKTLTAANYQTTCTMATVLPTIPGQYSYTVTLIPGRAVVNAGDINIGRPSPPTISCSPSGFVPVNTAVTCTCTTSSVGQPQGRLKGVRVTDGTTIATGDYGASSLRMSPHTLTASDHDVNTFRCDVEWVEVVTGQNYKPQVGLPPTQASLSVNGNQGDQVVNQHQSMTFHCDTTGGRPTPNVTLVSRDNKTELHSGLSPQQYSVTARCEDTGVYGCTADNGMGPVASSVDTMLGVQCFPRGEQQRRNVSFTGEPVLATFDITAYPVPHKVSFTYLGRCECQAGTARAVEGITLEGSCTVKTGAVYMSTCTVTVSRVTTEAAGVYQGIISNTVGNATFQLNVGVDLAPNVQSGNEQASYLGLAVGFGVTLAVVLVVIIVFFFWLWRRQWTLPFTRDKVELPKHPNIQDDRNSSSVVQNSQEANEQSSTSDLGNYQHLQMSDVGQMSPYSEFSRHGNQPSEPAYANTVVQTGSLYANTGT